MDAQVEWHAAHDALTPDPVWQQICSLEMSLPQLMHADWQIALFGERIERVFDADLDKSLLVQFSCYLYHRWPLPLLSAEQIDVPWLERMLGGADALAPVVTHLAECIRDQRIRQTVDRQRIDLLIRRLGSERIEEAFHRSGLAVQFPHAWIPCQTLATKLILRCCAFQHGPERHLELMLPLPPSRANIDLDPEFCQKFLATDYFEFAWQDSA